mmetsp:Transcript_50499/g.88171  ORF Transcript_50499/g.88171 Transcript_50499/m.88171 type:complete len:216 (-) Transcript_50499:118-765(-)
MTAGLSCSFSATSVSRIFPLAGKATPALLSITPVRCLKVRTFDRSLRVFPLRFLARNANRFSYSTALWMASSVAMTPYSTSSISCMTVKSPLLRTDTSESTPLGRALRSADPKLSISSAASESSTSYNNKSSLCSSSSSSSPSCCSMMSLRLLFIPPLLLSYVSYLSLLAARRDGKMVPAPLDKVCWGTLSLWAANDACWPSRSRRNRDFSFNIL